MDDTVGQYSQACRDAELHCPSDSAHTRLQRHSDCDQRLGLFLTALLAQTGALSESVNSRSLWLAVRPDAL